MLLSLLFQDPASFAAVLVAIVVAISLHEFAHAATATALGDPTAKDLGRLTFNPLAHLDPFGFILLLVAGFGWGKPVPFNPWNLKARRWGPALVSLAGPATNSALVVVFALALRAVASFTSITADNLLVTFLVLLIQINVVLAVFNLIPIPPLDGSKLLFTLLPRSAAGLQHTLERYGIFILIGILLVDRASGIGLFSSLFQWILSLVSGIIG